MAWRVTPQARTAVKRKEAATALHPFADLQPAFVSKGLCLWKTAEEQAKPCVGAWSFPQISCRWKREETGRYNTVLHNDTIWRCPCDGFWLDTNLQTIYRWSKDLKTGMPTAMTISHDLLSPACSIPTACSAQPCKALLASGTSIHSSHCHEQGNTQTRLTHKEQSAAQSPT